MNYKITTVIVILLAILCGAACIIAIDWTAETDSSNADNGTRINITIGTQTVSAVLYDNSVSNELLNKLPLTLSFSDYNNTEKIAMLPEDERLNTENAPSGYDPSVGDIAYYAPWGNLCIFYQDFRMSEGLIHIGKIEGNGINLFSEQTGNFEVTFSLPQTNKNILIAYFSWSINANTEGVAERIAGITGGALFEIVPEVPYTTIYDDLLEISKQEIDSDARPAIQNMINLDEYDTVYIGFPIWHGREPMIINTFLESSDFTGKTIIPFSTSGGSSGNTAYSNMAEIYMDAEFLTGLNLTRNQLSNADSMINEWFREIGQYD